MLKEGVAPLCACQGGSAKQAAPLPGLVLLHASPHQPRVTLLGRLVLFTGSLLLVYGWICSLLEKLDMIKFIDHIWRMHVDLFLLSLLNVLVHLCVINLPIFATKTLEMTTQFH